MNLLKYTLTALMIAALSILPVPSVEAIVKNPTVYSMILFQNSTAPTDGATRYFGANGIVGPTAVQSVSKIVPGHSGRITAAYLDVLILTTQGTSENSTLSLRLNATTDTTVSAVVQHDQAVGATERFSNTALNLIFDADDAIEAKIVYPTHATDPAGAVYTLTLVIEQAGR